MWISRKKLYELQDKKFIEGYYASERYAAETLKRCIVLVSPDNYSMGHGVFDTAGAVMTPSKARKENLSALLKSFEG